VTDSRKRGKGKGGGGLNFNNQKRTLTPHIQTIVRCAPTKESIKRGEGTVMAKRTCLNKRKGNRGE